MSRSAYKTRLNKLKKEPLYTEEMDRTSDLYIEHLTEKAMGYNSPPLVNAEVKAPQSEGTQYTSTTCLPRTQTTKRVP